MKKIQHNLFIYIKKKKKIQKNKPNRVDMLSFYRLFSIQNINMGDILLSILTLDIIYVSVCVMRIHVYTCVNIYVYGYIEI